MQRENFDISRAPIPPLRAETRHAKTHDAEGHIRGVEATSGGLIRATLGAAGAGAAILVFLWLPAEYGIDPTRIGRLLGLTEMGEIKQQLYAEAAAEDAALAGESVITSNAGAAADAQVVERLASIEAQVSAIAAVVGAMRLVESEPEIAALTPQPPETAAAPTEPTSVVPEPAVPTAGAWRDEVSYTLAPTEGIEVKLVMEEGAAAEFEWTANGAVLNYDTHGDGGGQSVSYDQGRGVPEQEGELVAAFTGNHGWFWRNRTSAPVTFTLRTRGDYVEMKAP